MRPGGASLFAGSLGLAALLLVIAGFLVIGSPEHIRRQQADQMRSLQLGILSGEIAAYRRGHGALPQRLEELEPSPGYGAVPLTDPEGIPFEYSVTGTDSYELCAHFALSTLDERASQEAGFQHPVFGRHASGRQCFSLHATAAGQK
ncbi:MULTISPECIES: hypothetical protein [Acidiphilium]|jgi:hypothetical protein|uniref:Type II secretion system protein n=2 Tax=Acidiphilium TaxID=522 RepID=A5G1S2_ACICJ|nr:MULTISPECIES: hypothetical protein [Acidiphilium]MBU6356830.1 hypothetical protein [Rhodospirillales bacterium]ABQ31804.1 hypothetical protein Acry_2613 [Acidiphilium cryptum JF-5]EGO94413.1 hypothetical protein APM_2759 [Acidiphilium sp. PM]KDM65784.1 hypothetical protein ACIDI_85c00050 [Acidiphilium sp. JA12-A1]MBS3023084.1 hypothetical protein [Acidiphilium multivorum]